MPALKFRSEISATLAATLFRVRPKPLVPRKPIRLADLNRGKMPKIAVLVAWILYVFADFSGSNAAIFE